MNKEDEIIEAIRKAVADYIWSEGCDCCTDVKAHREHEKRLAELLSIPTYSDGSGYDFGKFRAKDDDK